MASYDVFTPVAISAKMRSYLPQKVEHLLEPSVGTGQLLSAFEGLYDHADVCELNPSYLERVPDSGRITKHSGDFLTFAPGRLYDAIVMNPPYMRFQDMDDTTRSTVKNLSPLCAAGNIDLYVAFLVKCVDLLAETGTLIAVVPSTWLYNASCEKFKTHLFEKRLIAHIHDYGSEKVFKGVNVYCCILVLTRTPKEFYTLNGVARSYAERERPSTSTHLGDVATIQNGIATLCDSVFIHDCPLFDEPCWQPILKVSKQKVRYIIHPYENGKLLSEEEFQTQNPLTYEYLSAQKPALANRDKGNKVYEAWYAYGRKQGLSIPSTEKSVYISTLCEPTCPVQIENTMLFYSGLRITSETVSCDDIAASISAGASKLAELCSKRGSGWLNVTATTLKQIPFRASE